MNVYDFTTDIGDILGEDFTYSPIWTRNELFRMTKATLNEFSELTAIADFFTSRYVNATTGHVRVPFNFDALWHLQFDQTHLDIANWGDLDFDNSTWLINTTGTTARNATIYGSGQNAKIRITPVPSTLTADPNATATSDYIYLGSTGGRVFECSVASGVISTEWQSSGTTQEFYITTQDTGSTTWDVVCTDAGEVTTTASSPALTTYTTYYFADTESGAEWDWIGSDEGVITTSPLLTVLGCVCSVEWNSNYQDFVQGSNASSTQYGIIVDAYTGATTASDPDLSIFTEEPYGVVIFSRTADDAARFWYKGGIKELATIDSEIYLSSGLLPILQHGVLARAYSHDGDGRDDNKAALMREVFLAECRTVKKLFQRRWQ